MSPRPVPAAIAFLVAALGLAAAFGAAWAARAPRRERPFTVRPLLFEGYERWDGFGIAYGPHRDGQRPEGPGPTVAQVEEDIAIIRRLGPVLRIYGAQGTGDTVLAAIREAAPYFRVVLGVWLAAEDRRDSTGRVVERFPEARAANQREVDHAVELARAYPEQVAAIAVGNETQVFWSFNRLPAERLVEYLRGLRARVRVPVTTADDYNFWNKPESRAIAAECDFVFAHLHPLWNGTSVEDAVPWVERELAVIRALHPDRPVVIGETGWATQRSDEGDQGRLMKGETSEAAQARVYAAMRAWVERSRVPTFWFEAFDENWKGSPNPAEVEKHWGLYRADRTPKPAAAEAP